MIGYLSEGQTHASMLWCASNASARVVVCGSFSVVSMYSNGIRILITVQR